ncbi:MAG: GGDEF domain-containing protein [bacterium]|nr:GGDEF domain-containing protein [bacterium]
MNRDRLALQRWRDSLGIVVTVVSAVLLSLVLWRIAQLSKESGLDRAAVARERAAVHQTANVRKIVDLLDRYRYALVLNTPDLAARRTAFADELAKTTADLARGDGALLDVQQRWDAVRAAWRPASRLQPSPKAMRELSPLFVATSDFVTAMEDNSGLTYDPSPVAQNLADLYMQEAPYALSGTQRLRTLAELASKQGGLTLDERIDIATTVYALRTGYDVSADHPRQVAETLASLLPERKSEWAQLPGLANGMTDAGSAYVGLFSSSVLLQPVPTAPLAKLRRDAARVDVAARKLFIESGVALDADIVERGASNALRDRYLYLAFVLGAVLLVGIMIAIAQLIARRDRDALRRAHEESERLSAELARQEAEEALRLSEAQFRAVFDGAAIGIAIFDRAGAIVDSNDVFRTMFGDSNASALQGHEGAIGVLLSGERETYEYEQHVRVSANQDVWADATLSIVNDEGGARFVIAMFRDKTALKHNERRMQHDKTHDALTGLPNRQLFEEQLRYRFDEASALLDSFFAVIFVDLEHFKDVNESMGHAAGDLVLTQIAAKLRASVDARDVVARLGSDEFAILVQSLGDILHVESVARRILNNLSKPITIGNRSAYLGASVGIAIGTATYERAEDVMRDAEIAMQHAKNSGGTRFALFDSTMHERAQRRVQLLNDLRSAIDHGEFHLLYQPIVGMHDGVPNGCEALIRWDHPTLGTLNPSEFIALAEQAGLASPIGRFVLQTASEQLAAWRRNRGGTLDFSMHVNVSASELSDPDFERLLVALVEHHGLAPSDLTLEITENVVLDAGTRANATLERVRERGFQICIDDFGTGYSSLRYLQQFKVDAIKIDRSFVSNPDGEVASEPIVRTLMTLAEAYDVRVVAEGVETERQREVLQNTGCRLAQGFLFARPMRGEEMIARFPEILGRSQRSATA